MKTANRLMWLFIVSYLLALMVFSSNADAKGAKGHAQKFSVTRGFTTHTRANHHTGVRRERVQKSVHLDMYYLMQRYHSKK